MCGGTDLRGNVRVSSVRAMGLISMWRRPGRRLSRRLPSHSRHRPRRSRAPKPRQYHDYRGARPGRGMIISSACRQENANRQGWPMELGVHRRGGPPRQRPTPRGRFGPERPGAPCPKTKWGTHDLAGANGAGRPAPPRNVGHPAKKVPRPAPIAPFSWLVRLVDPYKSAQPPIRSNCSEPWAVVTEIVQNLKL